MLAAETLPTLPPHPGIEPPAYLDLSVLLLENTGTATAASLAERGYVKTSGAGLDIRVGLFQTPYAVDWEDCTNNGGGATNSHQWRLSPGGASARAGPVRTGTGA